MERYILSDFPVTVTLEDVLGKLKLVEGDDIAFVSGLYRDMLALTRTKAVYRICYVDDIAADRVTIDGIAFRSAVMAANLSDIHRVFAYVVTCGREVDDWSHAQSDSIVRIWLDMIKEMLLGDARRQFIDRLKTSYRMDKVSSMAPGSGNVDTWPILQQPQLFELIGGVGEAVGVTLTDSMLMVPSKSVSGILFPSERGYVSCALCRREVCVNRQVPFDPSLLT